MTPERRQDSAAGAEADAAPTTADGDEAQIDGGADAPPGTDPEGATPKVPRTTGDPLADAHDGS